jgi:pimeloyl-ACP methyl ester carboxylesterase
MPLKKPPMRRWARRLAWAALLYLLFFLIIWQFHVADRLIEFPTTGPVDAQGAQRQLIKTPAGDNIELWLARSPGAANAPPQAFVLFFVGNADRADRWASFNAAQWGNTPVEVAGMNLPGYGGSTGPAHLDKIGPAALAAYDSLRAQAGPRPIFLQANSLGTTAALCVLARRDVAGATLQNPPPLRRLILQHHGWWNLWLLAAPVALAIPSDLDSLANARRARAPAVFILSEQDEVVPVQYQRLIYDRYAGEKRLIDLPHASHNAGMDQAAWDQVALQVQWLWNKAREPHAKN